jgi:dolichol kinase
VDIEQVPHAKWFPEGAPDVMPPVTTATVAERAALAGPARPSRPANYARNLFHLASAGVALSAVAFLPTRGWLIAVPAGFALYAWSMELFRRFSPRLNERLMRLYGPVAHPHEWYRVNSATWYATALFLLTLFATVPAMMTAVVVLGIADPVAAFVGRRWGAHTLRAGRSLEGTLAFFASATVAAGVVLVLLHAGTASGMLWLAGLCGLVGATAELFSTNLDDNFTVPLAVGVIATLATPLLG